MKLTLLGGGGFRTPTIYRALAVGLPGLPQVDEVVLHDVDPQRLRVIATILAQLRGRSDSAPPVRISEDLDDAVAGADAVFLAIRVGGVTGRVHDERVALDLGLLGQETTGPGGIAFGLRTIPVVLDIAGRIAELAPGALVVNFTNPAGMITEALRTVLGERVVGICDTPADLIARVAQAAGIDPAAPSGAGAEPDYVGLNHLGWLRGLRSNGRDVLPDLLADPGRLATLQEAKVFGPDWLQATGCIPNEYLWYWYDTREATHAILTASRTRGEVLRQQQDSFYASVTDDPSDAAIRWERFLNARSAGYMAEAKAVSGTATKPAPGVSAEAGDGPGGVGSQGYAGVALAVLAATAGGPPATLVLNVANRGTVSALPDDAVIEVPATVDGDGIRPLPLRAQPDLHQLGLMAAVKAVDQLAIRAATTGSAELAMRAFAVHPLVDSLAVAADLLAGYRAQIPEVDAIFTDPG